ncbi:hypothetical protein C0J52_16488 [Blattella germanica]|nr:hypothetical protein C0J52_16488 [Blattella germanica]
MNRLDSFKLRIRKGNAVDAASRRGPVVARHHVMTFTGPADHPRVEVSYIFF